MTLLTAVAARGHRFAGSQNPIRQAMGVAIVAPSLAVGFVRRATDVALAMDLRGYRSRQPRTFVKQLRLSSTDWLAMAAVLAFVAASLWLRRVEIDLLGLVG